MADNVDALFPTYLPTGRLVTHKKFNNQRFKHKTFIHNNQTHDCHKKAQNLTRIMKRKSQNHLLERNITCILRKLEE